MKVLFIGFLPALALLAGCMTNQTQTTLQPITRVPAGEERFGEYVWLDLLTEDKQAAADFYQKLFGWEIIRSDGDPEYMLISKGGEIFAGMVAIRNRNPDAPESLWLPTLSVKDVDQAIAVLKDLGGRVLDGPADVPDRGRMALVADAGDAPLILLHAASGDPMSREAGIGEWLWTELATGDIGRAATFYSALTGGRIKSVDKTSGQRYDVLELNSRPVAGLMQLDWEGVGDNWLPYFRVEDIDAAVEHARRLGATTIIKTAKAAVLADPTGAAFGMQNL